MRVCDLIRSELDGIVEEWAAIARRQVPPAAQVTHLVLLDHLPDLLRELADWLEGGGIRPIRDYCDKARKHALHRLARDFDLRQIVDEYRILRGVIVRRLVGRTPELEDLREIPRMHEALDFAIAEAVDRFAKTREQMLLREAERARLALEAASLGTWEWFPKTGEVKEDERARALFGAPAEGPLTFDHFLSWLHPDDRPRVQANTEAKVRSPASGNEYRHEYRVIGLVVRVDRWIEARGAVIERDEHGAGTHVIGTVLDITERKRVEGELTKAAEFRERFVGIVSHDLRSPLAAIRMTATQLRKSEQLPPPLRSRADRLLANADRMGRMISDLLDLTRGRLGGGIPIEPKPTDLHEIAPTVLENVELAHPGRRILREERGHLEGDWDPDRIAQAIGNLAANACEHGDPARPVRVQLLGDDDERVAVAVHNEGAPIPPEDQSHIFDPFVGSAQRPGAGLGLGLFIANEIARAHGGRITLTSTATEGTTFELMLPRHPRAPQPGAS